MKFVCDSCKAQYMISDEKVGPAGVKVRCKKCGHVIHVKKEEAAAAPPPADEPGIGESTQVMQNPMAGVAAGPGPDAEQGGLEDELGAAFEGMVAKKEPAPEPPPGGDDDGDFDRMSTRVFSLQDVQKLAAETGDTFDLGGKPEAAPAPSSPVGTAEAPIEWYVAIDDAQVGPLTFDQLKGKWDGAAIGPDTLTWRPGLADWRPLSQIAELASKLAPRPAPAAREAPVAAIVPAAGAIAALTAPPASREPLPWERAPSAAAAASAAPAEPPAPPVDDDVDWKPSAASALASLVEAEMAAAKAPKKVEEPVREKRPAAPKAAAGPAREEPLPPPVETTGIRNLLEDLPEPPPQENSRIIPLPKDAVPGAMPEARPRVDRSTLAFERQEKKSGSPVKWIALGGVGLLVLFGGVIGVLFATGVIKPGGGTPPVVADAGGTNRPPEGDTKVGAPKEPVAKAAEPEKVPEKAPEPEKPTEPAKPGEEPAKVAEPAKLPDAAAAGASAAKEPAKEPVKVADARGAGGRGAGKTFGAPVAAAVAAKPEPEPEPEPVKKSGGKSSIDDLFETEFGGSSSAKAAPKKGGGVGSYIPPAPGSGSSKPKSLGQGDIMGVVVSHKADIKGCAGKYKATGGGTGTLVMAWTINPNGKTSGVRPKGSDHAPLASCIGGLIKGWKFPEYEGATMAPIEFPFNF